MAVLTHTPNGALPALDMVQAKFDVPELMNSYTRFVSSSTKFTFSKAGPNRAVINGEGLESATVGGKLRITDGTITSMFFRIDGAPDVVQISDLNVDAGAFGAILASTAANKADDFYTLVFGGNDTIKGATGSDLLTGLGGNDIINGNGGADSLFGNTGNDNLFGGLGADRLEGGLGADLLVGGGQSDMLLGQAGADTLRGQGGADDLKGGNGNDTLNGGDGNDTINGGNGGDLILGGKGNDVLNGGNGNDTIQGGNGADEIRGGKGTDNLVGQGGNDEIYGGGLKDNLVGNAGNDELYGGSQADTLNGGSGNDTMTGDAGADVFRFFGFRSGERDVVTDFQDGPDKIEFGNKSANYSLQDLGEDTLMTINGSGHEILFEDLEPGQITGADFI